MRASNIGKGLALVKVHTHTHTQNEGESKTWRHGEGSTRKSRPTLRYPIRRHTGRRRTTQNGRG